MASSPLALATPSRAGRACWRPRRSLGPSELRKVRGRAPPPAPGVHPAPPRWLASTDRDGGTAFCPAA
eukprot:4799126-Prymnesium_polylepis.1